MDRDKYGRFIGKSGIKTEAPKRDNKGRFLPKRIESMTSNTELSNFADVVISEPEQCEPIKTYTLDNLKHAYIAGLNESQGILPITKRFELYCKRNGIT